MDIVIDHVEILPPLGATALVYYLLNGEDRRIVIECSAYATLRDIQARLFELHKPHRTLVDIARIYLEYS